MNFEIGETVVETIGFFNGTSFTYIGEGKGSHPTYGERLLKSPRLPVVPAKPRYLAIAKSTPETQDFLVSLRSPEAQCLLGLEARDERADADIRKQYRDLTGEELVEGEGYNVAPLSAGKQGCEGYVTFNMSGLINMGVVIPEEVSARMVQRPGLINHLDFLWMLVENGFRVKRGELTKAHESGYN